MHFNATNGDAESLKVFNVLIVGVWTLSRDSFLVQ